VRLLAGPDDGRELVNFLRRAEEDIGTLPACDTALDALASLPRRRILATFLETLPVSAQ
jgi:hypothetical protein